MRAWLNEMVFQLRDIYSPREEHSKGRLISLGSSVITALYNVFITGIFYTGFLSMYGISITGVGIISFIPYIGSLMCVFSPYVLSRFKRRKRVILLSKLAFYALYIIATMIMPLFVKGETARVTWFAIILFVAYGSYALFSPGLTVWFYNFYPEDSTRRTRYIYLNQVFASVMSSLTLILSSVITDAVSGSGNQGEIIIIMRCVAFAMVALDVLMQSRAKEYPYEETEKPNLAKVFTLPFRYRKFMACMLLMFFWSALSNFNNGLWSFHLLNHLGFSYTLINSMSVMYTFLLMAFSPLFRRLLARYSWIKTFGICCLMFMPTELLFFMMGTQNSYLFIPVSLWQNIASVGLNLSYANVLYMNLPQDNSTTHITFYSIGVNLFAFLGLMAGTWVSSISGDTMMRFMGFDIYSVQITTLMRLVTIGITGFVCVKYWRMFTPDDDISIIESCEKAYRR